MDIASTVGPVILLGMLVAFFVAPAINALSMGEEAATSLGVSVRTTQNLTLLAVTVLAGAATAAVGPIGFVGLAVPFVVRALLGNDVRWVNYGSALLGPVWLLCADVLARVPGGSAGDSGGYCGDSCRCPGVLVLDDSS